MRSVTFYHNELARHFEAQLDELIAYIEYTDYLGRLTLYYTYIPDALFGLGVFQVLAKETFQYLSHQSLFITAECPLLLKYLHNHTEYQHLVKKSTYEKF